MAAGHNTYQQINRKKIRQYLLIINAIILILPILVFTYLTIRRPMLDSGTIALALLAIILMICGLIIIWKMFDRLLAVIIQNETENRNLEVMLTQSQKMEAIGTLAGGITHDFNNILAAILGYTELALIDKQSEGRVKRNLEQIQKACQRARELVNYILAFSRQSKKEPVPVQISAIVKEGLKMLRASIPASIQIIPRIESKDALICADPTQIHQVLMNLCINAAHAMGDSGGRLKVSLVEKNVSPQTANCFKKLRPGPYLRLTVSDEGHGVAPEHLSQIFDPYFTTKEEEGGSGLGLAVVRGIVKDCGGGVTVESEVGVGTLVHVYLPKADRATLTAEKLVEETIPVGDERILFIDDEQNLVEIGQQMLESLGYQVTGSTSSTEALKLFRTWPDSFDLVITDMTMPQINGKTLAIELMKIRKDIPIIICTGFSEKITAENAKMIGIKEFAMKPFMMRDLAKTIRKVLA